MPEVSNSRIDTVLDPAYVADLPSLSMDEVRARRSECQEIEVGLSYLRRLVQGRLDIVLADLQRRTDGGESGDLHSLVESLKDILADKVHAPGIGRLPTLLAPGEGDLELTAEVDSVVDPDALASLPDLDDPQVRAIADDLGALERKISGQRRALHDAIDALQDEIVRRYKSGEATVDSLLS